MWSLEPSLLVFDPNLNNIDYALQKYLHWWSHSCKDINLNQIVLSHCVGQSTNGT